MEGSARSSRTRDVTIGLAGSLSARRLLRAKARADLAAALPHSKYGGSLLEAIFSSDDVWSMVLVFLRPSQLARLRRVCKAAVPCTAPVWATWWYRCEASATTTQSIDWVCAPPPAADWTWERLHLCAEVRELLPCVVEFGFASDVLEPEAELKLDVVAAKLRRHPRLRILVAGHAQPGAPASYGVPLSQARATRVRTGLLERLSSEAAWQADVPREGRTAEDAGDFEEVRRTRWRRTRWRRTRWRRTRWRPPASRSRDRRNDSHAAYVDRAESISSPNGGCCAPQVLAFYDNQRLIGRRLQARGLWRKDLSYGDELPPNQADGQCAEVRVTGLDVTDDLHWPNL